MEDLRQDAAYWIKKLELQRHPEGGWYRETYRSGEMVGKEGLPERFTGSRALATSIYFLLEGTDFSSFHRIRSDEIWYFHDGSPLTVHILGTEGYSTLSLGRGEKQGQQPQGVVFAGKWFGATVDDPTSYSLVGCSVAPGFDFQDFELADAANLLAEFPKHKDLIRKLTR